jgi:hypothetical protein
MAEMTQTVFVTQRGHCNQDSLPLRFCFFFSKDSKLKIKLLSVPKPNKHGKNRRVFEGEIELPHQNEFISGTFVVADNEGKRYPSLVTARPSSEPRARSVTSSITVIKESKHGFLTWV